jgi:hypothetical protein
MRLSDAKPGRPLRRAAMEKQFRPPAGLSNHLDLLPGHATADPRAQCFRTRLFCRKTGREALRCRLHLLPAICNLSCREDPLLESCTKPLQRSRYPRNFHQIGPSSHNHAGYSFAERITTPSHTVRIRHTRELISPIADTYFVNRLSHSVYRSIPACPPACPIDLQGFSYKDPAAVLYSLYYAISRSGGWVMDSEALSRRATAFRIEVQSRNMLDLYAALSARLELTRWSHFALAERCTCRQHLTSAENQGQIVPLRLQVSFLEDTGNKTLF